jgi:hypothetical protein
LRESFEGKCPFGAESLKRIAEFKKIYQLALDSKASHKLVERKLAATLARAKPISAGDRRMQKKS